VIAKLPTEGGQLPRTSHAADEAGVDILNIHAGFRAAPGLDIYNGGTLLYPGSPAGSFGGVSGPWSRMISNRFIADVAKQARAPVMGGGGIGGWRHVVESVMYGARCVQICTAIMIEGFGLIADIISGLDHYMDEAGYATVGDFCGAALKNVLGPNEMVYADVAAWIDPERCVNCRKCTKLAACDAIKAGSEHCGVNPEACVGCGLCAGICPSGAISVRIR
jgi:NAD-dependent dihydropyrimidine dehydrogenase PreA subunit